MLIWKPSIHHTAVDLPPSSAERFPLEWARNFQWRAQGRIQIFIRKICMDTKKCHNLEVRWPSSNCEMVMALLQQSWWYELHTLVKEVSVKILIKHFFFSNSSKLANSHFTPYLALWNMKIFVGRIILLYISNCLRTNIYLNAFWISVSLKLNFARLQSADRSSLLLGLFLIRNIRALILNVYFVLGLLYQLRIENVRSLL